MLLITAALLFRMLGVWMSTLGTDLSRKERLFCMIAYLPKATVQAAIGAIPLAMGLGSGETILAVAVLAIILTAPLGALGIELSYKGCFKTAVVVCLFDRKRGTKNIFRSSF